LRFPAPLHAGILSATGGFVEPPAFIDGFAVVEYGYFAQPVLPAGYVPPPEGRPPLPPVELD
jgi:hypothetical protein